MKVRLYAPRARVRALQQPAIDRLVLGLLLAQDGAADFLEQAAEADGPGKDLAAAVEGIGAMLDLSLDHLRGFGPLAVEEAWAFTPLDLAAFAARQLGRK